METSVVIKILSLIPGLKSWAIKRFAKIEVTPKNGPGNNIFFRDGEDERQFVVKLSFRLKAYTALHLVDLSLEYGKGFREAARLIDINGQRRETDGNFCLLEPVEIEPGKLNSVFVSTRFFSDGDEADYSNLIIKTVLNAPEVSKIVEKTFLFSLAPGGCLVPSETQRKRIF